jgi:hypothetical protein
MMNGNEEINEEKQVVEEQTIEENKKREKTKKLLDEICKKQDAIRRVAELAPTVWNRMYALPVTDLAKMYLSICSAGEDYDPDCRYRERILSFLPDWLVEAEFHNLKMPVKLVKIIEDRIRPPLPPDPNSIDFGEAMVTPGPENE